MLVFNLFPCTDIEMNGYPISPLDTVVSSVTTHISIDAYKKLYFQNGRAAKGMLVIKSDEVDASVLDGIKLQFNASINNVANSFRTPIFGMGTTDAVEWVPFSGEGLHDGDFQFMYDQIARNIMSAFSMSPDELPGYSHLTRGTNSQTLSESNNEFKLTAARDTGFRPLILKIQTFFNEILFPIQIIHIFRGRN
jgi:phage portal protein BeeE